MTPTEMRELWVPAKRALKIDSFELEAALGIEVWSNFTQNSPVVRPDPPLSEELALVLRQLAGPHGPTILKAYRIKKGLE